MDDDKRGECDCRPARFYWFDVAWRAVVVVLLIHAAIMTVSA
jgi:hypothetical protein